MLRLITLSFLTVCFLSPAIAEDVTYQEHIKPLWEEKCYMCHGSNSPYYAVYMANKKKYNGIMSGPRMDSYADLIFYVGWPDSGALMRRLDDGSSAYAKDGKPGNMYEYLGESEKERQKNLSQFKAWVGEGGWNLNRWEQRDDVPGVTKEQMDKLKVKY